MLTCLKNLSIQLLQLLICYSLKVYTIIYYVMPRKPIDYSKTYFYKIVCKDPTIPDCYVGQTRDVVTRKNHHKRRCNNSNNTGYNIYVYQFIRDNGGWDNWEMVVIDCLSCLDSYDAHRRERGYLESLKATLNKQIPTRTSAEYSKQYYDEHSDEIILKTKQYYDEHRDDRLLYKKKYYDEHIDEIILKNKQYYDEHSDEIILKNKQYYDEHRDEINRKARERYALKKLQKNTTDV